MAKIKINILITFLSCITSFVLAATLTLDWAVPFYDQKTKDINSAVFDPVAQEIVVSNYGTDLSLERYNKDNGEYIGSVTLTRLASSPPLVDLSGFAIGVAPNGNLYLSDNTPYFPLWKTPSVTNGFIVNVAAPGNQFPFSRNLSIVGSGENTYIGAAGSANNGPIIIWKADNAECTSFSPWRSITGLSLSPQGAAKAGVGLSPVEDNQPPQWVVGCDVVGGIGRLRVFKYNPETGEYEWKSDANDTTYRCYDAKFDFTPGYRPVVAVEAPVSNTNGPVKVELFELDTATGRLTLGATLDLTTAGVTAGSRGSLSIDTQNKKIYVINRASENSTTALSMARLSYTLDAPTPVPTPTPTGTPTPTPVPNPAIEWRALWVTRWDYASPTDVERIMTNAANYHFNVVLFQVRGNATTFYPSQYEPWAWELTGTDPSTLGTDPGWDPLALAIQKAHERNLQLHTWVNIFPAWKETIPPPPAVNQLWNTHREWFMCDINGTVMWPRDWWSYWYTFIDPCIPEVQAHLNNVFVEIMQNYNVDGVHYDYCRYPSEVGDYSYNPISVARFQEKYGGSPSQLPNEWAQWKRDHITLFVENTYTSASQIRANIVCSCAVLGNYSAGYANYFQDSRGWLQRGIIDATTPMIYTTDMNTFTQQAQSAIQNAYGRYVFPGINAGTNSAAGVVQQITISRNLGAAGVTIFSYSGLFPSHTPNSKAEALLTGPFSNIASVPPFPWKHTRLDDWFVFR